MLKVFSLTSMGCRLSLTPFIVHGIQLQTLAVGASLVKIFKFLIQCSHLPEPEDLDCWKECHIRDSRAGLMATWPQALQQRSAHSRDPIPTLWQGAGRSKGACFVLPLHTRFPGQPQELGQQASRGFPAQGCSLMTAWMNWHACPVPEGKDVMSQPKISQPSTEIPSHPHGACRWFVYSPGWAPHPEIALRVFCAQLAGVLINRTRQK